MHNGEFLSMKMDIAAHISLIKNNIPERVTLVAVSKTIPAETILQAYHTGHRDFGENRVQELVEKFKKLPSDINWHLIGHLQTNKVKFIVPFIYMIHSVDSRKLLAEINKEAKKTDRKINCLLQMHIASEEHKFGFSFEEVRDLLNSEDFKNMKNVNIAGLMGMATFTNDMQTVNQEFAQLNRYFNNIKSEWFPHSPSFKEMSMGMSADYQVALKNGSTIIRVGSLIFGERN